MKIIFLDMDGVLNPMNDEWQESFKDTTISIRDRIRRIHPACANLLNEVTDKTQAKIVISSCWRVGNSVEDLQKELKRKGVSGEIIGKTPRLYKHRGQEIQAWLDEHKDVESFVIIDDDSDMDHLLPFLVRTNTDEGLTRKETDETLKRLM